MSAIHELSLSDFDRILAINVLARGFCTEEQLTHLSNVWRRNPSTSLAELLKQSQLLSANEYNSFVALLEKRQRQDEGGSSLRELANNAAQKVTPTIQSPELRHLLQTGIVPTSPASNTAPGERESEATTKYRMLEVSGVGGLGEVWKSEDVCVHRTIAIKRLKHWTPGSIHAARFLREAQITAQLQHPNIVSVYQVWNDPQTNEPMFSMDFISGRTFADLIREYRSGESSGSAEGITLHRMVTMFVEVCRTVAFAHSHGVIHRDLKPANIMVGEFGELFVLDWGLAKQLNAVDDVELTGDSAIVDPGATTAGDMLGSPAYMAPEQAIGDQNAIDERTDVFGLGAILFQLLTSHAPNEFGKDRDIHSIRAKILNAPPRSPSAVNPKAPRRLSAICQKALAARPEDRYESAIALVRDLEHWLARQPVSALPETRFQQLARWIVRRRQWTALLGVAMVLFVMGIGSAVRMSLAHQQMVYELEHDAIIDDFRWAHAKIEEDLRDQFHAARSLVQSPITVRLLESVDANAAGVPSAKSDLIKTLKVFFDSFPSYRRISLTAVDPDKANFERLVRISNLDGQVVVEETHEIVAKPSVASYKDFISVLKADSLFVGDVEMNERDAESKSGQRRFLRTSCLSPFAKRLMYILSIDRESNVFTMPHASEQIAVFFDHAGQPLPYEQFAHELKPELVQSMLSQLRGAKKKEIVTIPMNGEKLFCGARMDLHPGVPGNFLLVGSIIDLSERLHLPMIRRALWMGVAFLLLLTIAGATYWIGTSVVRIAYGSD